MSAPWHLLACLPLALLLGCSPALQGGGAEPTPAGASDPSGCAPQDVVDPACTTVPTETVVLDAWCDEAMMQPRIIEDLAGWTDFLQSCDFDREDPLQGLDWAAFDVVGTLAIAGGCNGTAGTSWLARCGAEHHLGYWSTGCGPCDAIWTTTHFVVVAASEAVTDLRLTSCVPTGEECE